MSRPDHGVRILTPSEAADLVLSSFEQYRDVLRQMAQDADGERGKPTRAALVQAVDLFNDLEEGVRASLGVPSRMGPELPEPVTEPEYVPPVVARVSPANRTANSAAWRMDARHGSHRSQP